MPELTDVDLADIAGTDLLSGEDLAGKSTIPGRGVWIIRTRPSRPSS